MSTFKQELLIEFIKLEQITEKILNEKEKLKKINLMNIHTLKIKKFYKKFFNFFRMLFVCNYKDVYEISTFLFFTEIIFLLEKCENFIEYYKYYDILKDIRIKNLQGIDKTVDNYLSRQEYKKYIPIITELKENCIVLMSEHLIKLQKLDTNVFNHNFYIYGNFRLMMYKYISFLTRLFRNDKSVFYYYNKYFISIINYYYYKVSYFIFCKIKNLKRKHKPILKKYVLILLNYYADVTYLNFNVFTDYFDNTLITLNDILNSILKSRDLCYIIMKLKRKKKIYYKSRWIQRSKWRIKKL